MQGVNRLFVLPLNLDDNRTGHSRYYLPTAKVINYNFIIDGKNFFDEPSKSYIKKYENIRKTTTGYRDNYTTGCLLHYNFFKKHYKMKAMNLSKQQALGAYPKSIQSIQQTCFTGKLRGNNNRLIFSITEEMRERVLDFLQGNVKVLRMILQFYFTQYFSI